MNIEGLLTPGSALGRYELLMPIAQGGMAAVWAARQMGSRGFEKTVAVKTMLPKLKEDPMFERMFLNEATLATRIQHPNVAQILDLGEHGDLLYIVMEWVDGEALSLLMRAADQAGERIPLPLAVGIVERASWGLHAAHEVTNEHEQNAGIVHRDVSPQNILVAYNGAVKVVDFGVAKAPGLSGMETNTGSLKGKVPFMSPEQASGGRIDRRTDIFAIGILLYKLLTGNHPFVGPNDLATLQNIIAEEPLPLRAIDPSIPPDLEAIVLRCLAKDPHGRFSSMADLAHALQTTAPRVSEQDIASYIGRLLGPRGAQRRATLKQAARSLGWALQTSDQMPRVYADQLTPGGATPPTFAPTPSGPYHARAEGPPGLTPGQASLPGFAAQVSGAVTSPRSGLGGAGIALIVLAVFGGVALVVIAFHVARPAATQSGLAATATTALAAPPAPTTSATIRPATPTASAPPSPSASPTASSMASATPATPTGQPDATSPTNKPRGVTQGPKPRPTSSPGSGPGEVDMGF